MTETELIEKAQQGDRDAFAALVEEWYEPMFRMAYKWCGHRQDAEDIVQNACIKLARSIGSFGFKSSFSSWLYRLVINTGIDLKRARREEPLAEESGEIALAAPASSGEDQLYAREMLAHVYDLPDSERTALILVIAEGMSHREAAEIMECKESTVSWHIHEARKKLQGIAEKERRHG
jgi:RNA polymerase sigma-70 factor (ECF subfamily)